MCPLSARFDPVWTHLHNAFHLLSHPTLFILHAANAQSKEWSVARLLAVCKVLNMVHACIVLDIKALTVQLQVNNSQRVWRKRSSCSV